VDGDTPGELNKETFSANSCVVTVDGRDIHPGTAKNVMVNSVRVISEIIARLPKEISPEMTEGYEPYIHPYVLEGGVGKSSVKILFRDFKTEGLEELKGIMEGVVADVKALFPKAKIDMKVTEQYRNMREGVEKRHTRRRLPFRRREAGWTRACMEANPRRHRRLETHRSRTSHAERIHWRR